MLRTEGLDADARADLTEAMAAPLTRPTTGATDGDPADQDGTGGAGGGVAGAADDDWAREWAQGMGFGG